MLREFRAHFFTWFGIVGAVVTIIGHWSSFLILADWVRLLSEHYVVILITFWNWLGRFFGLHVPMQLAMLLSLILFIASFTVGAYLQDGKSKRGIRRTIGFVVALAVLMFVGWFVGFVGRLYSNDFTYGKIIFIGVPVLFYVFFIYVITKRKISQTIAYVIFSFIVYTTFWGAADALGLFFHRGEGLGYTFVHGLLGSIWLAIILFMPLVPLTFAQPVAVLRRTNFILIGLLLIIALSEASKLVESWQLASQSAQRSFRDTLAVLLT